MKANLLGDTFCHGSLFTHLKSIQDSICLSIPAHRFCLQGLSSFPIQTAFQTSDEAFPKSLGSPPSYDQMDILIGN